MGDFPEKDAYRLIRVKEDSFGIAEAIDKLGVNEEDAEIYSSHGMLSWEESTDNMLRSRSKNRVVLQSLHQSLRQITPNEIQ